MESLFEENILLSLFRMFSCARGDVLLAIYAHALCRWFNVGSWGAGFEWRG